MAKTDEEIALRRSLQIRENAQELAERTGDAAWGSLGELTPDQHARLHSESSATLLQLLKENARLTEKLEAAQVTFSEEDRLRLTAKISAMALETFADGLQEQSGFLTIDAPGVADAREFAKAIREEVGL